MRSRHDSGPNVLPFPAWSAAAHALLAAVSGCWIAAALTAGSAVAAQSPQSLLPQANPAALPPDGPIDGFGSQMPLDQAVRWMVPQSVAVIYDPAVDHNTPVDWKGGASWHQALTDALASSSLVASFSDKGIQIAPPAPPPPPWRRPDRWHAEKGDTLDNVVRTWGRTIGVAPVVHGNYTYPVEAPMTIEGDFVEAVSQLTQAFSTAQPAPLVDFWEEGDNFAVELTLGGHQ